MHRHAKKPFHGVTCSFPGPQSSLGVHTQTAWVPSGADAHLGHAGFGCFLLALCTPLLAIIQRVRAPHSWMQADCLCIFKGGGFGRTLRGSQTCHQALVQRHGRSPCSGGGFTACGDSWRTRGDLGTMAECFRSSTDCRDHTTAWTRAHPHRRSARTMAHGRTPPHRAARDEMAATPFVCQSALFAVDSAEITQ